MSKPYLLLWLEAPLQAWGHDSKFGVRDSLPFPTKSGVLGLLCCALGAGGEQKELLAEMAPLDMQLQAYPRACGKDQQPVTEPMLRDFQMVGSGYDLSSPWQSLLIPKTSDGKKAVGGGTKLTYRNYLQDMAFAVLLQIPARCSDLFSAAFNNPVWDLYLGRKCCAPCEFIFQGGFEHPPAAFSRAQQLAEEKNRIFSFKVLQGVHEGEVMTLSDVPLQFGPQKKYCDRQITVQKWQASQE